MFSYFIGGFRFIIVLLIVDILKKKSNRKSHGKFQGLCEAKELIWNLPGFSSF